MKRVILTIFLLCWYIVAIANITTELSQSKVHLGEMFRLTLTIDNPKLSSIPDLTPLQENFSVVGTEQSTAYSNINGQGHTIHQWIVLLTAKKKGTLLLPAIRVGLEHSTAMSVKVVGRNSVVGDAASDTDDAVVRDEVMLKTETSPQSPYINQQVIYTVKLFNSQRLMDAEYHPPVVDNALLVPLGDGRRYQTTIGSENYAVEEQEYALFPQKSGELNIIAPSFSALVFDGIPRRVNAGAQPTKLKVKPIPKNFSGKYWLPAQQLSLTEVYDQSNILVSQGATLTRTVTIQAAGVPAQLLPTLSFDDQAQFNVYPEKPELKNSVRQHELVGRADVKVTYLLNKTGHIIIPALKVTWFNISTNREEQAVLPQRTIEVQANMSQRPPTSKIMPTGSKIIPSVSQHTVFSAKFAWLLALGLALGWIITLLLWYRGFRFINPLGSQEKRTKEALQRACEKNNPKQAEKALLKWAAIKWPKLDVLSIDYLARLVEDAALKKQMMRLAEVLYRLDGKTVWEGAALWRAVVAYKSKGVVKKKEGQKLPPINPGSF
jgi:hypothetical protein